MLKLAIVGGGPSAFYVASRLLQESSAALRVHIYDRVWAPYGLVRYGVAPDHPDVKNCTHKFAATAADPRLRFFGNVHVGNPDDGAAAPAAVPLPLADLFPHYTHLLLAPGAPLARTLPALPHLPPALSIVHWYTAHPDAPMTPPVPPTTRHLTILGLGNVSLDVARILLTHPAALARADIPAPVLAALARLWPALRHIAIVGRRGPRAARWAPRELRELLALPHARLPPLAIPDDDFAGASRPETRILHLLRAGSTAAPADAPKSLSLHFYQTPLAHAPGRPLVLEDTRTRAHSTLPTDCVLASLGFAGDSAPWPAEWFDPSAGHLRHHDARVVTPAGAPVRNVYVSGWAAHGARGVIASTLLDAKDVAARILADYHAPPAHDAAAQAVMPAHVPDLDSVPPVVREGVAAGRVPGWAQWALVDKEEQRRGEAAHKERERMDWDAARAFLRVSGP